MLRALLEEEGHILFDSQRKFGNEKATEKLEQEYLEIMLSQRSFDMGPGQQADGTPSPYAMEGFGNKVGYCTLERESGERRAAKATYTVICCTAEDHTYEIGTYGWHIQIFYGRGAEHFIRNAFVQKRD